jgi:uncharacterized membrane protein YccC
MSNKLCLWFGLIAGGFVGLLLGLLHGVVCCSPPQVPTWSQLALDGLVVALIAVSIAAAFACLLSHLRLAPVFALALLIGALCAILLSSLAYHLPHPLLAAAVCALLGALIGWLVCRVLCRDVRSLNLEVSR